MNTHRVHGNFSNLHIGADKTGTYTGTFTSKGRISSTSAGRWNRGAFVSFRAELPVFAVIGEKLQRMTQKELNG